MITELDTPVANGSATVLPQDTEQLTLDLRQIDEQGIFVAVEASGFHSLEKQLDWRSLGVQLPKTAVIAVRAPRAGLLPEEHRKALRRPMQQAYEIVKKYGHRFAMTEALWGGSFRWVPWTAFETFEEEFAAEQARLGAAKLAVLEEYDDIRTQLTDDFVLLAQDAARKFRAQGVQLDSNFIASVVEAFERDVPTKDYLAERLYIRRRIAAIQLGSDMLAERRKQLEEMERMSAVQREAHVARAIEQARLGAEQRRLDDAEAAHRRELAREEEIKRKMDNLRWEAAKEMLGETLSPLQEGARQLQAELNRIAREMAGSLKKNGYLHASTKRRATEMADWFRAMNWQNDLEMQTLVEKLESLAANGGPDVTANFSLAVNQLMAATADAARRAEPNRMAALEL